MVSSFKSSVNCTFSNRFFQSKNIFPGSLNFFCLRYSLTVYLHQCVVSNFYRANHRFNVRIRRDTGIYCLLVNDLGGVQVVLGVQSLERLENLLIFNLRFCL